MTPRSASGKNRNADQHRPSQDEAARGIDSQDEVTGTDLSEPRRSGEDTRTRGWYWHWNAIITQYAPLIRLKGVGLLNSYTVWTDRRDSSPHRGFAFPSQQSEADFYGEDRAELITMNKILVVLDLIEIRKEMVPHPDGGKGYRVPHNFYRVKDHADDFNLTARDVMKVVELAGRDKAVFRMMRHIFSQKFSPIAEGGPWPEIVAELSQTELWQALAAKVLEEEERASARTRAGHANRKGSNDASRELDDAATVDTSLDTAAVASKPRKRTSVAPTNKGLTTNVGATNNGLQPAVAPSNKGLDAPEPTSVAPANNGSPTYVGPTNRTYNELPLTTTTTSSDDFISENEDVSRRVVTGQKSAVTGALRAAPEDGPASMRGIRAFEDANGRMISSAERTLLTRMADKFDAAALARSPLESGWSWIAAAVYEAVEAGSAFVAPRRVREILTRWEREGAPAGLTGSGGIRRAESAPLHLPEPERAADPTPATVAAPGSDTPFIVAECGIPSGQVWAAVLDEIVANHRVSRADRDAWLRATRLAGRSEDGALIVIAPSALAQKRIATRLIAPLRAAVAAVIGKPVDLEIRAATFAPAPDLFTAPHPLDAKAG